MNGHAVLPPSSAGCWGECSGWVVMNLTYPELEDTPEAMEGDASHWVGESMISAGLRGMGPPASHYVDTTAPNGVVITEDMAEAAEVYARHVLAACREAGVFGGRNVGVEERLYMPQIHPEHNWGTCDAFLFDQERGVIHIWDYKYGHLWVDEFENWQLIDYFGGLINRFGIDGIQDQHIRVKLHVIQPRAYGGPGGPIRTWECMASDLRGPINRLHDAAAEALGPYPQFKAGAHCRYCPGRHACPALAKSGWALFEFATAAVPVEMTPAQLGTMLMFVREALKRLEAVETGISEQVEHAARQGHAIPGYTIEPRTGREKWTLPTDQVLRMGEMLGVDLRKISTKTPNQARKAGMDPAVVETIAETPKNGVRVVPDKTNKAKRLFST